MAKGFNEGKTSSVRFSLPSHKQIVITWDVVLPSDVIVRGSTTVARIRLTQAHEVGSCSYN